MGVYFTVESLPIFGVGADRSLYLSLMLTHAPVTYRLTYNEEILTQIINPGKYLHRNR